MDKVCPTFDHFSVYEQKLTKLSQNVTVFPSHLKNIFLKSFVLLQNLRRNCKILQKLMRFHKTNEISWSFSGIILSFAELQCTLLTFSFIFGTFNFGFVQTDSKFWSFKLGNGKS